MEHAARIGVNKSILRDFRAAKTLFGGRGQRWDSNIKKDLQETVPEILCCLNVTQKTEH